MGKEGIQESLPKFDAQVKGTITVFTFKSHQGYMKLCVFLITIKAEKGLTIQNVEEEHQPSARTCTDTVAIKDCFFEDRRLNLREIK